MVTISTEQYEAFRAAEQWIISFSEYKPTEPLVEVVARLQALRDAPSRPPPNVDQKATARGEALRLLRHVAHYAKRALEHEEAIKREASVSLVISYARRLSVVAEKAGILP